MTKKIIITADDFGISVEANEAIKKAYLEGILNSTCIMANGKAYQNAIFEVLPQIKDICFGIHLNIIEGKTQVVPKENSLLYNNEGEYNNSFLQMLIKSFNKNFLDEVEKDFRQQIEAVLAVKKPSYICSHVHIHAIPKIFELTSKLAKEYKIEFIRTQGENFYFVPVLSKHLNFKYFVNIIKHIILNIFTFINKKTAKKYDIKTNDRFIGVLYTGNMEKITIEEGIKHNNKGFVEIILHPLIDETKKNNYGEYKTLLDKTINLKGA